jgi:hypothetical protein
VTATYPHVWLGPQWYAWLEFGPGGSHAAFEALAGRLRVEFGAIDAESVTNLNEDGKEYLYLQFGQSQLLLMRRADQIGLGASYPDLPRLVSIGAAFGAVRRGWRWPLYDVWHRLMGRRGHAKPAAAPDRSGI